VLNGDRSDRRVDGGGPRHTASAARHRRHRDTGAGVAATQRGPRHPIVRTAATQAFLPNEGARELTHHLSPLGTNQSEPRTLVSGAMMIQRLRQGSGCLLRRACAPCPHRSAYCSEKTASRGFVRRAWHHRHATAGSLRLRPRGRRTDQAVVAPGHPRLTCAVRKRAAQPRQYALSILNRNLYHRVGKLSPALATVLI